MSYIKGKLEEISSSTDGLATHVAMDSTVSSAAPTQELTLPPVCFYICLPVSTPDAAELTPKAAKPNIALDGFLC